MPNIFKLFLPLVIITIVACGDNDSSSSNNEEVNTDPGNIAEVAQRAGSFNTLLAALEATGLDTTLADETGTFTVFAPTDEAFDLLGQDTIDALLADPETLSDILLYHVVSGVEINSTAAIDAAGTAVEMANGDTVSVSLSGSDLYINLSNVSGVDVDANNGIIHVIDRVLIPPAEPTVPTANIVDTAVAAGNFTTLVTALQATGLDTVLADPNTDFTVFAPTDDAFAKLGTDTINALLADTDTLSDILLYHVVSGTEIDSTAAIAAAGTKVNMANTDDVAVTLSASNLYVNLSVVTVTDIVTTNGIIHVIDTVLSPPADNPTPTNNIVETAIAAGDFTTLVAALQATGLDATLADAGSEFTVFAPTDDAFALLGTDTINALLADTDTLSAILLKHVVSGAVDSVTALSLRGEDIATVNPETVRFDIIDGEFFVNDSQVTTFDIETTNGIIHVIDAVIQLEE